MANSLLASQRGGVAERSRKYCTASAFARTGWCSDRWDKEHHPAASLRTASRHFLVTPPPLLAVMRGGEFALFNMRPQPRIAVSAALDAPLIDFCNPNLDRCAHSSLAAKTKMNIGRLPRRTASTL